MFWSRATRGAYRMPLVGLLILASAMLVAMGLVASTPAQAHASEARLTLQASGGDALNTSAGMIEITSNGTVTSYDITGDGIADTIRLVPKESEYHSSYYSSYYTYKGLDIYVNGKHARSIATDLFNSQSGEVYVITLKNGAKYLYVHSAWGNGKLDGTNCLYTYKKAKLAIAFDVKKLMDSKLARLGRSYGYLPQAMQSVSGNTMKFSGTLNCSMVGDAAFNFALKYKNGKIVIAKRAVKLTVTSYYDRAIKARRSITAYKSATGTKKAFTIKKGQKVKFKQIYLKDRQVRLKVKVGSKVGWISLKRNMSASNIWVNMPGNKWFTNLMFTPA